jgi:hypothetical protein
MPWGDAVGLPGEKPYKFNWIYFAQDRLNITLQWPCQYFFRRSAAQKSKSFSCENRPPTS